MFTTTQHRPQSYHQHQYQNQQYASSPLSSSPLAASPSPLSQRCGNLPTYTPSNYQKEHHERERIMSSPTPVPTSAKSNTTTTSNSSSIFTPAQLSMSNTYTPNSSTSTSGSKYSKRQTKHNPLMHGSKEDGRETRRKLFLKRVREGSEEKRWQNRGGEEEIMRVLWCGEERRRLEGLRAEGRGLELGIDFESGGEIGLEDVEGDEVVDEVARREEEEMMYLRGLEESQLQQEAFANAGFGGQLQQYSTQQQQQQERPMSIYGSDDDEYDDIFQDVIEEEMRLSQQTQQIQQTQQEGGGHQDQYQDQDMMDLS